MCSQAKKKRPAWILQRASGAGSRRGGGHLLEAELVRQLVEVRDAHGEARSGAGERHGAEAAVLGLDPAASLVLGVGAHD